MTVLAIATVGLEEKDITVLKSLLPLVARLKSLDLQLVDDPAVAQVACLGRLPPERITELVAQYGGQMILVYCCSRGEDPPPGVRVLGHCPPRANELAEVLGEAAQRATAATTASQLATRLSAESSAAARAARTLFDPSRSLPGAIHDKLPRLLIDQPLAVIVPDVPPLLIDVRSGVRTAHGDPAWFSRPDYWRVDPTTCQLTTTFDARILSEGRRFPARPIQAVRFWGVMSASQGMPRAEILRATEVGLKKMPDFKMLPHLEWQPRLAETMMGKLVSPESLAATAGRPLEEIYDFLNAVAELGLLKTG
jgi:hypothetical protein